MFIEDLTFGKLIAYMDFTIKTIESAKIEKMENVNHYGHITYNFESKLKITESPLIS
jgi:hypothetical protein